MPKRAFSLLNLKINLLAVSDNCAASISNLQKRNIFTSFVAVNL